MEAGRGLAPPAFTVTFVATPARQHLPVLKLLGADNSREVAQWRAIDCEASLNIPRIEMMKEVINWMDKYWRPPTPQ